VSSISGVQIHRYNYLPTSFNLPDGTVDRLRDAARRLLRESEDYQRLLALLRPPS
jgi:hypothetical protein